MITANSLRRGEREESGARPSLNIESMMSYNSVIVDTINRILDECCKEGDFEFSSDDEATPTERKPVFTEEEYQRLLRRHKKRRRMKKVNIMYTYHVTLSSLPPLPPLCQLDPDLNTCGITLASIAGGTSSSSSAAIKTEHHPPPPSPSNNSKLCYY